MKKFRVLHLISSLDGGGAETTLSRFSSTAPGWVESSIVVLKKGGKLEGTLPDDIDVHWLNVSLFQIVTGKWFFALRKLIREQRSDAMVCWMYKSMLLSAPLLLSSSLRRKTVWNVRHSLGAMKSEAVKTRFLIRLIGLFSKLPAGFVFLSKRARDEHCDVGYAPRKVVVAHNGVMMPEAIKTGEKDLTLILGLGRNHILKNWEYFIQLSKHLSMRGEYCFKIAGKGVLDLAKHLEVGPVELLGEVDDVVPLIQSASMLLITSRSEGFSNVMLEALVHGVPCCATDVGDAVEIIRDDGCVIGGNDPKCDAVTLDTWLQGHIKCGVYSGAAALSQRIKNSHGVGARSLHFHEELKDLVGWSL